MKKRKFWESPGTSDYWATKPFIPKAFDTLTSTRSGWGTTSTTAPTGTWKVASPLAASTVPDLVTVYPSIGSPWVTTATGTGTYVPAGTWSSVAALYWDAKPFVPDEIKKIMAETVIELAAMSRAARD